MAAARDLRVTRALAVRCCAAVGAPITALQLQGPVCTGEALANWFTFLAVTDLGVAGADQRDESRLVTQRASITLAVGSDLPFCK